MPTFAYFQNQLSWFKSIFSSIDFSFFKFNLIIGAIILIMQALQQSYIRPTPYEFDNSSDEEAFNLFKNINPNLSESEHQPQPHESEQQHSDEQVPQYSRLSKLKKQSKEDKKLRKTNKKKSKKQKHLSQFMNQGTPRKRLKKQEKKSKRKVQPQGQDEFKEDRGSSQQDSFSNHNDLADQLNNLNPDSQQPTPKRLKKSNRKVRIEEKQGFRIQQLGNDPQVDLQKLQKEYEEESYSFDDIDKKKNKKKSKKKVVPTNEEIMQSIQNHGVVESQEEVEGQKMYDNGLQGLSKIKDKKKNGIKINNRMFNDLEIDFRDQEAVMSPPEQLQLDIKPKSSTSQNRFSFLMKAQNIKKQRGLEANINMEQFQKEAGDRAKKSLAKIVSSMASQEYHQQLDIQIRIPTIARGKSADIINNTVFLKRFISRNESASTQDTPKPEFKVNQHSSKRTFNSRNQFFRSIVQQNRLRRSNYISEEYLKNSFKKTNLQELQQARKKIEQKRKREAFSEEEEQSQVDEEKQKNDKELDKMIELEQNVGEQQQAEEEAEEEAEEDAQGVQRQEQGQKNKEIKQLIEVDVQEDNEKDQSAQENQQGQQQQQINEQNEIIDELAQVSSSQQHQPQEQQDYNQNNEQGSLQMDNQEKPSQKIDDIDMENVIAQRSEGEKKEIDELEEQGITLRKKIKTKHYLQDQYKEYLVENIDGDQKEKENLENQIDESYKIQQEKPQQHQNQNKVQNQEEQFKHFRKLRKIAVIIAQKKKQNEMGRRYAAEYLQNQAQEGSDNQDHDDIIKNIDYDAQDKQFEGLDLDADLVELIDNAVDINQENQYQAFRKYLQDVRIQDRQQIRKIIKGQFKKKHQDLQLEVEQDERMRQERMQEVMDWMKKRQEQDGEGIYVKPVEEEQDSFSDQDSMYRQEKKKRVEQQVDEEDGERMPEEEERAMIERFIEETLPTSKKQVKTSIFIDLGPLPESIKLEKSLSNRTISISKLGSKISQDQLMQNKSKKTSSLVNQMLNRKSPSMASGRQPQKSMLGKLIRTNK